MLHSIIIPHRDRNANLELCLWSLRTAAGISGDYAYEIILVDGGSKQLELRWPHYATKLITLPRTDPLNKPALLNAGIEAASGSAITFLDADAVVAPRFFRSLRILNNPAITKVCYRVKTLPLERVRHIDCAERASASAALEGLFADYRGVIRREAYVRPDFFTTRRSFRRKGPVFGNSQFSIRRKTLGDLRFDEEFSGHGYEDIDLNWRIWREHFETYKAVMVTNGNHAMYHLDNPRDFIAQWGLGGGERNVRRYRYAYGQWKRAMRKKGVQV